jgi:hypothetical protein
MSIHIIQIGHLRIALNLQCRKSLHKCDNFMTRNLLAVRTIPIDTQRVERIKQK